MSIKDFIDDKRKLVKKAQKNKEAKNIAIGAGTGVAVGAAAGLLLAPKKGKETREDIVKGAKKVVDAKEKVVEAKEKALENAAESLDKKLDR